MITFTLPMPPSANVYWRVFNGRPVVSPEAREYKHKAWGYAKEAGAECLEGDVALELRVFRARKRGDVDNRIKVLLDSMIGVLYDDDDQVTELHVYRDDDKKDPRVEVKAWEVE